MRTAITLLTIMGLSFLIAGCGVRGPLEPPPEAQVIEGQGPVKEEQKPHRGFILDKLLN